MLVLCDPRIARDAPYVRRLTKDIYREPIAKIKHLLLYIYDRRTSSTKNFPVRHQYDDDG